MDNVLAGVSEEVRILGLFWPSKFEDATIQSEIRLLVPNCCAHERINIYPPGTVPHPDTLAWHQDGGGPAGTTKHIVVWASEQPTEIRLSNGELVNIEQSRIVWVDNTKAFHRKPIGTSVETRWFVVIRCSGE